MKNEEIKIESVNIDQIIPYWNNARNNKKAIKVVEKSIQRFGFNQPIAIDMKGEIIAGHTRFYAASNLGMKEVPCVRLNLTEEQCKQYRIADNKAHEFSTWDNDKLLRELRTLESAFEMQDFFFEPIGEMIGFEATFQAPTPEYDSGTNFQTPAPVQQPSAPTEKEVEKFNESVSKKENALEQKPAEFMEFDCPHCGKPITLRK